MARVAYILPILFLLAACGTKPEVTSQKNDTVDGNTLQVTSGTVPSGRFVAVANIDKRWEGKFKGGREKWVARRDLLQKQLWAEMERICQTWPHIVLDRGPHYNMLDKDETMGGLAPMLGSTFAMAAYVAAASATDDANIPTSGYADFHCRSDEEK
jgi:hypothetical protein